MAKIEGINGNMVEVDSSNRMLTEARTSPEDHIINEESGKVWSVSFKGIDPAAADDYFFYMKNDGAADIEITDFRLESTVAGCAEIHVVSGVASSGSDITPVSRNLGSSALPSATIQSDPDFTGLTNDGILFFMPMATVGKEQHLSTSSRIIIPPNKAMAILWDQATGALSGTVSILED